MSKQWILLPDDIAKLNETSATVFGFGIPNGGSSEAKKSDTWEKCMNWVACGSYLEKCTDCNYFSLTKQNSRVDSYFDQRI